MRLLMSEYPTLCMCLRMNWYTTNKDGNIFMTCEKQKAECIMKKICIKALALLLTLFYKTEMFDY